MKTSPTTKTLERRSPAVHFRGEIEKAEAAGVEREDMTLRLTLGDVTQLKRDTSLALSDISFKGGVMRYLDVRIVQGGVTVSLLDRTGGKDVITPAPAAKVKPAPKPRKAKAKTPAAAPATP